MYISFNYSELGLILLILASDAGLYTRNKNLLAYIIACFASVGKCSITCLPIGECSQYV
jgi:hypothetical protein